MLSKIIMNILTTKGDKVFSRFEEITKKPMEHNLNTLLEILNENKDTEYGRKYNFAEINNAEDYRKQVPYSNYDTYAPYIEEMKKGAGNFITKAPPVYFAATSGSVANPKAIPVSEKTRGIYKDYGSAFGFAVINKYLKQTWTKSKMLNIMEVKMTDLPCGVKYGSVSGMAVSSVKRILPLFTTTPIECSFSKESFEINYAHLRFALTYEKLSGVFSAFMAPVTDIFRYLKNNWELLVDDIEKGTINEKINMPEEMRRSLMKKIKPNPKRAAKLRAEFSKGFEGDVFKRIWPDFAFVYAIGSGGFASYTEMARIFTGGVPMYFSFFAASESMMAVCTEMESPRYALLPDAAFYEFIPVDNSGDTSPVSLTLDQIKAGEKYELVLTNPSGFYRYRIGDVVEVVGMYNNTPQIQFSFRLNQAVNMAGEKTNDSHVRWAIKECADACGINIVEYSVLPKEEPLPGRYVVLIEGETEKIKPKLDELRDMLEAKLSEANPSFGAKIKSELLGPVELRLVQEQTYALYRDLMVMRGISVNQIKPIRIIDTPEKEKFFFALIEEA